MPIKRKGLEEHTRPLVEDLGGLGWARKRLGLTRDTSLDSVLIGLRQEISYHSVWKLEDSISSKGR